MFPNGNSLLNKMVQILRNFRSKTMSLENAQDLASSNAFDQSNAVRITKNNINLDCAYDPW